MQDTEKQLARALEIALELIKLQHNEIEGLKVVLFALRDSVASGKPPLPFEDAQGQVFQVMRESGYSADELLPLMNQQLQIVRDLLKGSR